MMQFKIHRLNWHILIILLLSSLSSCRVFSRTSNAVISPMASSGEIPTTSQPTQLAATIDIRQIITPTPEIRTTTIRVTETKTVRTPLPTLVPRVGPGLAFLKDGDIWIVDKPGSEPYPLTVAGDIIGFTWAPNGERLAAFNGHTLCFFQRDGSVRTACLDLGLNEEQAAIERRLILSPDQRWIVLWNPENPQETGTIGWMIVALDTSNIMYRIQDPIDWGAELTKDKSPGGFTGVPIFLPDGRLIGTLSHREFCESVNCRYQLFEFVLQDHTFVPFTNTSENHLGEGPGIELSKDGRFLINFGTFYSDCSDYIASIEVLNLENEIANMYEFENTAVIGLTFDPDMQQAILARSSGCINPDLKTWSTICGLATGIEILPMQLWKPEENSHSDLLPGISPTWSPDGEWIAFESCLVKDETGEWQTSELAPPVVYLTNPGNTEIIEIQSGAQPQWQP
jgi:hypothetical protein